MAPRLACWRAGIWHKKSIVVNSEAEKFLLVRLGFMNIYMSLLYPMVGLCLAEASENYVTEIYSLNKEVIV